MSQEPTHAASTPDEGPPEPEERVGFWRRMFGGGSEEAESVPEPAPPAPPPPAPPAPARVPNRPRAVQKSIFDRAEEEQRRRYAQVAARRRERLAAEIGARVEEVLETRLETGQEQLAQATSSFTEMNDLLGAIGRNLDDQSLRAERMAQTLEVLPEAAEREHAVLQTIATSLQGQQRAMNGVPEVLALMRHGQAEAERRMTLLRGLKDELELQRQQGEQVIEAIHRSTSRFEERMGRVEEALANQAAHARSDAQRLKNAVEGSAERLVAQARETLSRDELQQTRLLSGLQEVSRRLSENNVLTGAEAAHRRQAMGQFHAQLLETLTQHQSEQAAELRRVETETRERSERNARRTRLALVGSAGFLGILGASLFGHAQSLPGNPQAQQAPAPVVAPAPLDETGPPAREEDLRGETTTLPAGMPRPRRGR